MWNLYYITLYLTIQLGHLQSLAMWGHWAVCSTNFLSWLWKTKDRHLLVEFGTDQSETKEVTNPLTYVVSVLSLKATWPRVREREWASLSPYRLTKMSSSMYISAQNIDNDTCNDRKKHIYTLSIHELNGQLAEISLFYIWPVWSWSPEKTVPPDLAGMARMKQHERWAGMLLEKAGVQQHWHWEGLEMWRGSPFVGEVYLWENSQAAQSEVMSGLFSYSSTKGTVQLCLRLEIYRSFINCVGSLFP